MRPENIDSTHVAKYLDQKGNVGANRDIALLSSVFRKAIRWGYVKENPCLGVERNEEHIRERYVTGEEFIKRQESMPEWIAVLMDVAYFTSLRRTDLLKIKLKDITESALNVVQSKTGKEQEFQLKNANGMLNDLGITIKKARQMNKVVTSFYLFANRRGQPYTSSGFNAIWYRHAKKDGIENFQFRDIRSKAVTDAKQQGLNPKELSGHKTDAMVDRYVKIKPVDKVQPLRRINSV